MTVYSTKATQTRSRINLSASTRRPQLFGFARRRLAAPTPRPCWAENGKRPSRPPRNGSGSFARKIPIAQPQQRRRLRRPAEDGRQFPFDGPCIPPARDAQDTHAALRSGWQR